MGWTIVSGSSSAAGILKFSSAPSLRLWGLCPFLTATYGLAGSPSSGSPPPRARPVAMSFAPAFGLCVVKMATHANVPWQQRPLLTYVPGLSGLGALTLTSSSVCDRRLRWLPRFSLAVSIPSQWPPTNGGVGLPLSPAAFLPPVPFVAARSILRLSDGS